MVLSDRTPLENASPAEASFGLLRLEAVRRVTTIEKDLDFGLPVIGLAAGIGQTDSRHVLYAVNGPWLALTVERVRRGLLREVELVPLNIGIRRTVIGCDRATIAPAAEVVATLDDGRRRARDDEID